MRRSIPFVLALVSSAFLSACGGSTNSMTAVGGVPMSLTIRDTPPSGVAVLFFEASITGASLQPSDSTKPAVSVLSAPVEVEFGHLQTDTAFLSLANVPARRLWEHSVDLRSAQLTIANHSGAAIGSCANNTVAIDAEYQPLFGNGIGRCPSRSQWTPIRCLASSWIST